MKKTKEKKIKIISDKNKIKIDKRNEIKEIFPDFNDKQIEFLYKIMKK